MPREQQGRAGELNVSRISSATTTLVLILLVVSVAINYLDRGVLSVSAPILQRELTLSPTEMGLLFSAFFWSYAVFQLVAGWLVDRYEVKHILSAGFLVWCLATASVGWITGFGWLLASRVILGVGESVAYPAYSHILARDFAEGRRGLANALVDAGSKLGPALSTLAGGLLVGRFGWRALFLGMGLGGLLWLIPWILIAPSGDRAAKAEVRERPTSMMEILRRREAWGTCVGMFSLGYVWYFLLSWLPSYLVNARGFSMQSMAVLGSLPFGAMACTSVLGGWLSDWLIRRGHSATGVRKTFVTSGLLLCCVTLLPAAVVRSPEQCVMLLVISCAALGFFTSNVWAITQTLAGPKAAGSWTGVQNAIGNLGGVISPLLTGVVVARTGSYYLAFATASVMLVLGAGSYLFLVGEVKPLRWEQEVFHD
ncbi:MAG: MFS transporter [Acidobacteriia bacterium]|jgi:MFS family permease|nr:MFS transporter [Terriglobia bacterium]